MDQVWSLLPKYSGSYYREHRFAKRELLVRLSASLKSSVHYPALIFLKEKRDFVSREKSKVCPFHLRTKCRM